MIILDDVSQRTLLAAYELLFADGRYKPNWSIFVIPSHSDDLVTRTHNCVVGEENNRTVLQINGKGFYESSMQLKAY